MTHSPDQLLGPVSPLEQPEVRAIYVMTLNGSASVAGRSHDLGDETDSALLMRLREWSDAVLVGAGTVRAEDYRPLSLDVAAQKRRSEDGRISNPVMAIVSSSLNLDPSANVFSNPEALPIVVCPRSAKSGLIGRRQALQKAGVTVIDAASDSASDILSALRREGFMRVSCEGGPSLYAKFLGEALVDVLHLTLDPHIALEGGRPIFVAPLAAESASLDYRLELVEQSSSGCLFVRYRRL